MNKKALWLTVEGAKSTRGPANFRKVKEQHDAQATGARGGRRFQFKARRDLRANLKRRDKFGQPVFAEVKKWKRIAPVSKRRQLVTAEYRRAARAFVQAAREQGERCPVLAAFDDLPEAIQAVLTVPWTGNRRSNELTETHHRRGRAGLLLMDKRWWMAVSRFGHRAIGMFPAEARKRGWLCKIGDWNRPDKTA